MLAGRSALAPDTGRAIEAFRGPGHRFEHVRLATHGPLVGLPVRDERPRRSGRRAVGAAAAALALALGSAALMSGGGDGDGDPVVGGEPAGSLDAADGPTAADDPAPPADLSDTACGWTTQWLEAEALGDQEAQDQVVARMAEEAAAALAAREEQRAVEAEALMRTMSAGDVATLQAHQADSCTG